MNKIDLKQLETYLSDLFPICRSITGNGVRDTLERLNEIAEFQIKEIPSGKECYDWTIPNEWNIFDAYVENSKGEKIVDFKKNNLHLVNYSIPIDEIVSYEELHEHIYTLPDLPDAIPYRTSYYKEDWGFCLSHNQLSKLNKDEKFHIKIDATLKPGKLTYGEFLINGKSDKEFLFSTYCCHPSLANDNLSGPLLWTYLLKKLQNQEPHHNYRFIIVPETIGAIAYLHQNEKIMKEINGGFILTCVGSPNNFSYKNTIDGNDPIDKIVYNVFDNKGINPISYPFDVNGSDETHYSAPFFRIPIGTICKDKYYEFPYYHTSFDDLDFVKPIHIEETYRIYENVLENIELKFESLQALGKNHVKINANEEIYTSLHPYCEPMLSKRGLYPTIGGKIKQQVENIETEHLQRNYKIDKNTVTSGTELDSIGWLMLLSDGMTSISDISKRIKISEDILKKVAQKLVSHNLLKVRSKS